ncbi:uncharacterized protein F4807DRAFT_280728 [Annulohypoxylon truncatum]|uniref:uncharacterized protein n=1 Tax=Annulohypoxylon truncatum TaxID=327061 RepID=UPI0020087CA4|nr:uncharacterized protein F4807DRAFT_280728 [Annulohypoxylon truncatum]KAI1205509.1 hypothetical protein F4807DRAFT_280728 [Annulohypoxylon truncatum]
MPPSDSGSDTDITEDNFGVVDMIEELTEVIHEQVTERPTINADEERGNHNDNFREFNDVSPDIPRLMDGMLTLTKYNEQTEGRNYNILKEKYEDQLKVIKAYGREIQEKVKMIRSLKWNTTHERKKVERECQELRDRLKGISEPPEPWSHKLRVFLRGEGGYYNAIWRDSCKQENMSQKMNVLHPDLILERQEVPEETLLLRRQRAQSKYSRAPGDYLFDRRFLTIVMPDIFFSIQPVSRRMLEQPTFPFEQLPAEIQVKIFARVFVKNGLVHCLSRLDPWNPPLPEDFPMEDVDGQGQLPTGFHYGSKPCQIALARKPNEVLDPLLVSKRWFFIGVHAFYGANTFAFSSLGEWHRFCNGIGMERVERLTNVELMWHGSKMRRHETRISRRSVGLSWFLKTKRLRTLVVHIQESANNRMRRKYEVRGKGNNPDDLAQLLVQDDEEQLFVRDDDEEQLFVNDDDDDIDDHVETCRPSDVPFDPIAALMEQTEKQANKRKLRSMRTVQGMDYIYQLRGMNWIRFKERDGPGHRQSILDPSFLEDIERAVTRPKRRNVALMSELQNLSALTGLQDWIPSEKDMQIIQAFYDESPDVDWANGYGDSDDEDDIEAESESEAEEAESDDNNDVEQPLVDNEDEVVPPEPAGAPITPPATPAQQLGENLQGRDGEASKDASDDDDRSSGLFVSSRSNSTIDPFERMEVDENVSLGDADVNMRENVEENRQLPTPSSSSAGPSGPTIPDPMGEDDGESLFVRTPSPHAATKIDLTGGQSKDQPIDLTMLEDSERNSDSDASENWDYDSDADRYIKQETPPPDSDDEPPAQASIPPRRPPPKRRNKKNTVNDGSAPKRRKLNKPAKAKR